MPAKSATTTSSPDPRFALEPARPRDFALTVATEEVTACDLCGGQRFALDRTSRDLVERLVAGVHRYLRCLECRVCFLSPRPTPAEIGHVYPADYAPHTARPIRPAAPWQRLAGGKGARPSRVARWWIRIRQRQTFHPIPPWVGEGKILDIGCGSGALLDTLRQLGWDTHGLDPSPRACATAQRNGHAVRHGSADQLDYPPASFDVVYLNQVLEHTFSPAAALRRIHAVLRPGGALVMSVPNYGGLQMRVLGQYSSALDPPRHLYQFERATLRRYLEEAGFRDLVMTTRTGSQSVIKAARLLLNELLGTAFRREPTWLSTLLEPFLVVAGWFGYFGAGRDLRVVARK